MMKKFFIPGMCIIVLAALFFHFAYREEPDAPGRILLAKPEFHCTGGDATTSCYEQYYRDLVLARDAKEAVADVKKRYEQDPFARVECHQLVHAIGRVAGEKYGTLAEAYADGSEFCSSGYYHGVTEYYVREVGKENFTTASLDPICASLRETARYSLSHHNCTHGLGHGFMYVDNNELFEALAACDYLSDPWERSSCHGGVFMENVIADNKNHFTKYLKPDDPLYPCNAVSENYKDGCYINQTSYALKVKGGDFAAVFALCEEVASPFNATCFQSIGRDGSGWSQADPNIARERCLLGKSPAAQSNCAIGAMKDIAWYRYSAEEGMKFCELFDAPTREECRGAAEAYAATLR